MSYANPSDEVAEDYLQALKALELNSRYEISNLTVIAKENTEHALAISEAVKTHIKQVGHNLLTIVLSYLVTTWFTFIHAFVASCMNLYLHLCQASPQKKLPAFYVLDSVVKNVGTPYTLFFGRQLYTTFMEAYALVDNSTRRKMDEMLKTWKEPVPGSMDTRPVFPPDITRPIENALIKARTSALQQEQMRTQQQGFGRSRPIAAPYREIPTPPGVARQPMPASGYISNYPQYPPPAVGQQQYPHIPNQQYQPPTNQPYPTTHIQQYPPPVQEYPPNSQYPQVTQQYPPNGHQFPTTSQQYPSSSNQQYPVPNHQAYPPTSVQQYPSINEQQYASQPNGHQPQGLPQVSNLLTHNFPRD